MQRADRCPAFRIICDITINILETNLRLAATGGAIKDADNHAHKTVGTAGTASDRREEMAGAEKFVYRFGAGKADGSAEMRNLLGGKGANLAEMANLGL
ncbi:MAG: hypothetical protein WCF79_20825, partial [Rhodomicrobium sp.]